MIQTFNAKLKHIVVHKIGNASLNEDNILSQNLCNPNEETLAVLTPFFLSSFSENEVYTLTHQSDISLNELFIYATKLFSNPKLLVEQSKNIANNLIQLSQHHKIKSGELYCVYFQDMMIENETVDVIGIFKTETKENYFKIKSKDKSLEILSEIGINSSKIDRGCLIFNTNREKGYKVCVIDKASNSSETQYWKDDFLKIKPFVDEFHNTKNFLSITKNYVTQQLPKEFEISKADQIDLLNRSMEYFKENDSFDKKNFENQVFNDTNIIESFQKFDGAYRQQNDIEIEDIFDISPQAVKKQARIFKSVLKLDKNFHIYIHGNRELIEQGVEKDGRKYYKIYFQEEN